VSVYVVVTAARGELIAMRDLLEADVPAYTPVARQWRWRCDRKGPAYDAPLLPGYVFVWSRDIRRDWETITAARRVVDLLRHGERPLVLRADDWLTRLMVAEAFGLFDYTRERKPKMSIGQAVRVVSGPFKGALAVIQALSGKDDDRRARIKITTKCFAGSMTLETEALEAA